MYVNVKTVGRKKNYITKKEINLRERPNTLRKLIEEIVTENAKKLNHIEIEKHLIVYLTGEEIELQSTAGKISFKAKYNEKKADIKEAVEAAILAFEDGLYKVFIKDDEIESLDLPLKLDEGDVVTFIRLTMLSGRMW